LVKDNSVVITLFSQFKPSAAASWSITTAT